MGSQCKGITKSGTPCKITITFANGYCRLHQNQYVAELPVDTNSKDLSNTIPEIKNSTPEIVTSKADNRDHSSLSNCAKKFPNKNKYIIVFIGITICYYLFSLFTKKK